MEFLQPVQGCVECQQRFQEIQAMYRVFQAGSTDPGLGVALRFALKYYRWHHNERHLDTNMEFLQPVQGCAECQRRFQEIQAMYRVFQASSTDPSLGLDLRFALKYYRWHHDKRHSNTNMEEKQARKQQQRGWSWRRIAGFLGLPGEEDGPGKEGKQ